MDFRTARMCNVSKPRHNKYWQKYVNSKSKNTLTTSDSSSKSISLGNNFMNKPDFSKVTKKNGLSDKERAARRQASGNYNEDGTVKKNRN